MNTVEHIVECYFRYCKNCFTITDVKVPGGNNRQCDLLAYNIKTQEQYHVESSVTHQENWCPSTEDLPEVFDKKFRGTPPKREGKKTDYAKGKAYYSNICETYRRVGFSPRKIKRVFITWKVIDENNLSKLLRKYKKQHKINVLVWSFRDVILPELINRVSTSNYDDEVLRTLSLLRQRNLQVK